MRKDSKIYLAGHTGLVGSAIFNLLKSKGYNNLIVRTHKQLDLKNTDLVETFFKKQKPEYVILAAAKVGGIAANDQYRADFIYDNIMIQTNVIHSSYLNGVRKLLFLGSTCIYPKDAIQPIQEISLLTGLLEYTNEAYAIAKIAGIKMCEAYNLQYGTNYICAMPTNLYGNNDNYDLETAHVLPALIRKFHLGKCLYEDDWEAIRNDIKKNYISSINYESSKKEIINVLEKYGIKKDSNTVCVEIWGTGNPRREFMHSEDVAEACFFLLQNMNFDSKISSNNLVNIGTGIDVSINELSSMIISEIGFKGSCIFNKNKPDGTMRKITDISKIRKMGWKHRINLQAGLKLVYKSYKSYI